ncbi:carbamoyl-phosphate synthase large subunit [uncultured delta proteobacterium]|uniref:Carbamoyl phosphate synthase large chain n=1 Tax=uncultured delta proteobacterium TaxID=34034 RepID=A0A212KHM0_9DELT|nr:carbamoyl-phosphate synthase large subunit [uncultured delta proteobacterium]
MPKRTDIKRIMVIGSGPIVIGQAAEFDYSGTQAVKSLKEEGCEVILANSNPATIMTDPGLADRTYIEPLDLQTMEAIIRREKPNAILPTMGGQTGLNLSLKLAEEGVLSECGVELIGADSNTIATAESRQLFKACVEGIGLKMPAASIARTLDEVREAAKKISFPIILRPAFTLGGAGGGVAYNMEDLEALGAGALAASMKSEVLVEQSVLGWKEIEIEIMRDAKDQCIIICTIENFDAMGVHTGDSIAVAPAMSLSKEEIDVIIAASKNIIRAVNMVGGANIQFALNPVDGELVVIEMNPRVSRSSALASKATGFPIARVASKLALGYTLDEIRDEKTGKSLAEYTGEIDYVVVKVPRFTFEKFSGARDELTTSMKSVGETLSMGATFKEALQKGLRSLEVGVGGWGTNFRGKLPEKEDIYPLLRTPNSRRVFALRHAMLAGMSDDEIYEASAIDYWFLKQLRELVDMEREARDFALANAMAADNEELRDLMRRAKAMGFSDAQLAEMWKRPMADVRVLRHALGVLPESEAVKTYAGKAGGSDSYYYSSYRQGKGHTFPEGGKKVIILGGGPNRIGQGIEFDYCCCHASYALKDMGVTSIMVNSNPETVSTDFDTSDRLYFEPLTFEDVMNIVETEKPHGVIVQFGGQTPLNLAVPLMRAGVPIIGTSPDSIDRAEDRERFQALITKLGLLQTPSAIAMTPAEAMAAARQIGFPVVVRPSYVLGGRAMMIVYDEEQLKEYFAEVLGDLASEHPILVDKFLEHATEVDVDALSDGEDTYVAGIMEHIEEAGIHSGDSACVLPPYSLPAAIQEEIARQTKALAKELRVIGLMNIQFAVKGEKIYVLEVNPRASRTAPFVSKATGVPLPRLATQIMLGAKLKDIKPWENRKQGYVSVKEAVFPFNRFPGVDILLGPEMKSTGEVMGIAASFEEAFYKSQLASGQRLPESGKVFLSVNDHDKPGAVAIARIFHDLGFEILATAGTAKLLGQAGVPAMPVLKVYEGRPNIVDRIKNGEINLVINTASGKRTVQDSKAIRQATLLYGVAYSTTLEGAKAMAMALKGAQKHGARVKSLQEYYGG